jgi:hypothetical protein
MAAMECASRATFVTAVPNAARCPCRTTAPPLSPRFFALRSVRVASVHTPRASVLGGARRNANLSGIRKSMGVAKLGPLMKFSLLLLRSCTGASQFTNVGEMAWISKGTGAVAVCG